MKALHIGASGMSAQQTRIDNVANNLANVNTTAYKKSRATFQDVYYQQLAGGARGVRADLGGGTRLTGLVKDHSSGTLQQTGDPLHVGLAGPGLLQLEDAQGRAVYTRDGSLRVDADGTLRSATGLPVAGDILIPEDTRSLQIEVDGTISAVLDGDDQPFVLGQLMIAQFTNVAGLRALGNNHFEATTQSGEALLDDGETQVRQGHLETSNVDAAEELIGLVAAQRAYELNSKVIQTADEALQIAANLKR
ncbi:MAG: flagellar hook-basal body complex protein [Myxococcales bacterium]|nr:flagellar hook-basal body complex protein [Myxococcales bacterium]